MKKEKVILAKIYLEDGRIGIEFGPDANINEINYFLESYTKVERENYEDDFRIKSGDHDEF